LLELIKAHRIRAGQEESFGTILLHLIDRTPLGEEIADEYQGTPAEHNDETQ
jgi:chromatin segregation and condensation protein Rec8/ScpA/Scc1 (kleisin family)